MLTWYTIGWKTYVADVEDGFYVTNYKNKDAWRLYLKSGKTPPKYLPPYLGPDYGQEITAGRTLAFCQEAAELHALRQTEVRHERSAEEHYKRAVPPLRSPSSFRLTDQAKVMLRELAVHHGLNITNTLELLIRDAHRNHR